MPMETFMFDISSRDRLHFQTFGFVVLRQAIDAATVASLSAESDRTVRDATGSRFGQLDEQGGITGHFIPATSEHTPLSMQLAQDLAPAAETLLQMPLLFVMAQHTLLFDATAWHDDTGHDVPSIKALAYLDALKADTGALRVLPGSHVLPAGHINPVMTDEVPFDEERWRQATRDIPCHVIDSQPGDVILFDEHLWHASIDGRNRRLWSAFFVKDPKTRDEETKVRNYLASQFVPDMDLDYDARRYPSYGRSFRKHAPKRWVERLDRLGAFAAADQEERSSTSKPRENT